LVEKLTAYSFSSKDFSFFFNLDCQNLAMLGFDNCQISENEKSLSEKEKTAYSFSTSEQPVSSY